MSFPRYPAYRESGVQWIASLPAHWDLRRFKSIFAERIDKSESGDELLLSVSAYTGITPRSELVDDGDHLSRAESLEGYKRCFKDDLVMNIMLAWNRGLAFTQFEGIVSPAYCVFKVIDGSRPKFLNYLVRSDEYTAYFKAFSSGVIDSRLRIYPETFGALLCALPPTEEQAGIGNFLDHETAKIDALVAEQDRLIEMLKEKRQAVISHAVTKGLDPSVAMKDPGVEWLGEVPAHWALPKLKEVTSFCGGGTPSRENLLYWNGDIPWVSPKDMKNERIVRAEESITEMGLRNSSSKLLSAGQVLMVVRSGILQHTIPVAINQVSVALNQDMKSLGFDLQRVVPEFFLRWVQGLNDLLLLVWAKQGATVESIEQTYVANTVVPLPDLLEQTQIVEYLGIELGKFDSLIAEAQSAIALLKERRTALISAAVTGHIDVRGWTPPPDAP